MASSLVLSLSIGCDQLTKRIAEKTLPYEKIYSFIFDTFRLHYIKNKGAFLGFGAHFPESLKLWIFLIIPLLFLIAAALYVIFSDKPTKTQAILISLIVGGGISNLVDRFMQGSVTDFLNVGIGSLRTGIFNIADVAIMAGAIGLFIAEISIKKAQKNS
jgi:signal peptidase II